MSTYCNPEQLGIQEITKEQYLAECAKGLKLLCTMTVGGVNPANPAVGDVVLGSMCRPGEDTPWVSYASIGTSFLFTRGYPWSCTPLKAI